MAWFIGLMSGTSLDGVDAILAETAPEGGGLREAAFAHLPLPESLRTEFLALNTSGPDEIHRSKLAANALAETYALAVHQVLALAGVSTGQVQALGAHGQTVRHRPREFDGLGYTVQLLNGALLAERCGIDVVCDFRSRDLAAGGQGAPLVPAFHAACFGQRGRDVAVLNLGGMANLSLLRSNGEVLGFDCGPGNVLLDLWCQRHLGTAFDAGGAWAASGRVDARLLATLLQEPFLQRAPPKSTGRDLFNAGWLDQRLAHSGELLAVNVMATLADFSVCCAVNALARHAPATVELLVCGGGAFNAHLMQGLRSHAGTSVRTRSTAEVGVGADRVEALAFAWLARAFMAREPGNLPAVTGASGPRILGALYPAG